MNRHLSAQLIEQYRQRALSPASLLDADDHLAVCETCRQQLGGEERAHAAARSLRAELAATGLAHLAYEQLSAYVEGDLGPVDLEIADSHLKLCARCAGELDDLRAFAAQFEASPAREYAPVKSSSLDARLQSYATGWRERIEEFWRPPTFWIPVRLASIGLIVGLLFWAALLRSQNSQLRTALDVERQANEKLKEDYRAANASAAELQNQLAQLKTAGGQPSSPVVIALNDGAGQVTLDREGNLAGVPSAFRQPVKQALATERIETPPMLAGLAGKSSVLMGPADEGHPFALLGPVGIVVMTDRPNFRWRAPAGAEGYVVKVYDADFNEVAASPQLSGTTWTATRALERGRTYSWQVTARMGDKEVVSPVKPAPEARFLVLDQAKADELAKAKNAGAGSHLTLGVLYAQAGLLDDAERELQALLRANPRSALAEKLLRSVRARRRS